MITAQQAADILGMSVRLKNLRASDPEPRESPLAVLFRKMAAAKQLAREKLKKQKAKAAAKKKKLEAADRKEKRRPLVAHHAGKRRAAKIQRTPAWADQEAIRAMYEKAKAMTESTGIVHHVDHEIPLQGRRVSGLHVENNLCVIPAADNIRKYNHYEVES